MTVLDDHTKMSVVRPLPSKAAAGTALREEIERLERLTGDSVTAVRSDRGGEYLADTLKSYFKSRGITHQMTAGYNPQQNATKYTK